ncbi:MAG: hypothetical protein RB294_05960 [Bacteroidales bacterium]|jgi:hypothetical protein|nr:hypothetical protein [Bacteroidales bacterium]
MILVFSEKDDISAMKTRQWLEFFNAHFIVLENTSLIDLDQKIRFEGGTQNLSFVHKGMRVYMNQINVVWNRRGMIKMMAIPPDLINQQVSASSLNRHFYEEQKALADYFYYQLKQKKCINFQHNYNVNKLITLSKAQEHGIAVPDTLIGRHFPEFSHECRYVTKNLQDVFSYSTDSHYVCDSVKEVDTSKANVNDTFFYSLFQKKIRTVFEIRTFFFMDLWYSLAIFPAKTVDYREQVYQSPPRMVPIQLPTEYKKKLQGLMADLDLNSGSIDTLYDGKDYYFLEVNPVGQFDFVSGIGNYYIERDIALKLKQLDENEQ